MTEKRYRKSYGNDLVIIDTFKKNSFSPQYEGVDSLCNLLNAFHEENERLKNQRRVYDKFLDLNDLEIDWQFLCDADECNEEEDMDCRDCKYLGVLE